MNDPATLAAKALADAGIIPAHRVKLVAGIIRPFMVEVESNQFKADALATERVLQWGAERNERLAGREEK